MATDTIIIEIKQLKVSELPPTIEGASYVVYELQPIIDYPITSLSGELGGRGETVTYYTSEGKPIVTAHRGLDLMGVEVRLDSNAPKPKIASYRRVWLNLGKSCSGYVVYLHDKNGFLIDWKKMETECSNIHQLIDGEYDLSEAVEEEADFSERKIPSERSRYCLIM